MHTSNGRFALLDLLHDTAGGQGPPNRHRKCMENIWKLLTVQHNSAAIRDCDSRSDSYFLWLFYGGLPSTVSTLSLLDNWQL